MQKEKGIVTALTWVKNLIFSSLKFRKETKEIALEGILQHIGGEETPEMKEFLVFLKKEAEFIGFIPSVSYIKEKSSHKEELEAMFVHPFSVPTLLYKIKNRPALIIVNVNLSFNDSVLCKISENKYNEDIKNLERNVLGITG